jgi:hypothetical protein
MQLLKVICVSIFSVCIMLGNFIPLHAEEELQVIDENKEYIWTALIDAGYTEEATAGIMGNLIAMSGLNPEYIEGGRPFEQYKRGVVGIGISQWARSDYQDDLFALAEKNNTEWSDLTIQVKYLIKSISSEKWSSSYYKSISEFKEETDVDTAAEAFMKGYIRPIDQSSKALKKVVTYAEDTYAELATGETVVTKEAKDTEEDTKAAEAEKSTESNEEEISEKEVIEAEAITDDVANEENLVKPSEPVKTSSHLRYYLLGSLTIAVVFFVILYIFAEKKGYLDAYEDRKYIQSFRK